MTGGSADETLGDREGREHRPPDTGWNYVGLVDTLRFGTIRESQQTCSLCVRPMGGATVTGKRGRAGLIRKREPRRNGP